MFSDSEKAADCHSFTYESLKTTEKLCVLILRFNYNPSIMEILI
jgi:hypothetical protein